MTLEETKQYSLPEQRLSLIVLLECHLEDLQKGTRRLLLVHIDGIDLSVESIST